MSIFIGNNLFIEEHPIDYNEKLLAHIIKNN